MKKLILIFCLLLLPGLVWADMNPYVAGIIGEVASASVGSCAGDQTIGLNPDGSITITTYTLAVDDCSDGPTTGTVNGDFTVETGPYFEVDGAADYLSLAVTSSDIFDTSEGTVVMDFYITTFVDNDEIFRAQVDANNYVNIRLENDGSYNHIRSYYKGSGTYKTVEITETLSTATWYTVTLKWRQGESNPCLSIDIGGTAATEEDNLIAWTGEPSAVWIGNAQSGGAALRIRNVELYTSWQ